MKLEAPPSKQHPYYSLAASRMTKTPILQPPPPIWDQTGTFFVGKGRRSSFNSTLLKGLHVQDIRFFPTNQSKTAGNAKKLIKIKFLLINWKNCFFVSTTPSGRFQPKYNVFDYFCKI